MTGEMLSMSPMALSSETSSLAMAEIQSTERTKPVRTRICGGEKEETVPPDRTLR